MLRLNSIIIGIVLSVTISPLVTQANDADNQTEEPNVVVTAKLERIDDAYAELVVTAEIKQGVHIYAQSQPKPFLPAKLTILSPSRVEAGEFTPERDPAVVKHPLLGHDLHQFENEIRWRTSIERSEPARAKETFEVTGELFAQACEAGRCYSPQTYRFTATLPSTSAAFANADMPDPKAPPNADSTSASEFSLSSFQIDAAEAKSAITVLPLAFLAGLLLNLMPCVLPVVGLKLLSFVQQAQSDRRQIFLMNLAYSAGLMSVMLVLATLATFAGLGWGQQFSSPVFTIVLAGIVFAFGLSFLGVWEIPLPGLVGDVSAKAKQEGYGGAFSKGVLSTLLATPCSGPFLGAALAWAVTQPTYLTYSVFAMVGLGMASPYLIVGAFPAMIRFLPKPGSWMVTFKQVMGFIMLGTVIYLLSFMSIAAVVPTGLLLLGVGFALWFTSRTSAYAPLPQLARTWVSAIGIIAITTVIAFGWLQGVMQKRFERSAERLLADRISTTEVDSSDEDSKTNIDWQTYSPELLEQSVREGKTVFVDFTADWCLTCKANESAAIETEAVAAALRESGAIALRADKTEPNPASDTLLRQLGNSAASIPFYAVFKPEDSGAPTTFDGLHSSPDPFVKAIIGDANQASTDLLTDNSSQATSG